MLEPFNSVPRTIKSFCCHLVTVILLLLRVSREMGPLAGSKGRDPQVENHLSKQPTQTIEVNKSHKW